MDLRQLRYLVAVARHGHFTRAAEELYVTQSALSQQVRRLEATLGVELLRRTAHGVELTPAGADLLPRAEALLAAAAEAEAAMEEHAGVRRGVVCLGCEPGDGLPLARVLAAFHRERPQVQLALRQDTPAGLRRLLAAGGVDLAVVADADEGSPPAAPAGLHAVALGSEVLRVIAPPGDPLTETGDPVPVDALRDRPLVLAPPATALRDAVMAACAAAGFSPVPRFEVAEAAAVRALVSEGLAIGVVPPSWLEAPGPAVDVAPLAPAPLRRLVLLRPAEGATPAARALAEHLVEALGAPTQLSRTDG